MRAISAPTSAARFSKFSGQCSAHAVELSVVGGQRLDMLLPLVGRRGEHRRQRRVAQRAIEMRYPPFQSTLAMSTAARCARNDASTAAA